MVQMSIFDMDCQPYKIKKPMRLIELFGGIGSQAKALENLNVNFEHYRLCEFDKYAVQSYNAVHGTNFKTSDITKITAADLGIVETNKYEYIMTYSFPCQDLSIAGKQSGMAKGSGTRSGLLWEVERLLRECKELPQVLLMENVTQVTGTKNFADFEKWLLKLEKLGYKNTYQNLNAKDYGIPQNRNRTFMVSMLGDYYYEFPKAIPLTLRLKDMLEEKVDEKYYLRAEQLENIKLNEVNTDISKTVRASGHGSTEQHSWDMVAEKCKCIQVAQIDGSFESTGRIYGDDGLCPTINTMGGGGREPKILEPLGYDEQNQRLRTDGTVGTLTTDGSSPKHNNRVVEPIPYEPPYIIFHGNRYKPIHYKTNEDCEIYYITVNERNIGIIKNKNGWFAIRKLTPKETFRLMGFTDSDFDKAKASGVSDSQLYKQAGNSIVVPVLEAIFRNLF